MNNNTISKKDALYLRRHLAGLDVSELDASPMVKMLIDVSPAAKLREIIFNEYGFIGQQLMQVDPSATDPSSDDEASTPPLPKSCQLVANKSASIWYDTAREWTYSQSPMTPTHMLDTGLVWLIGLVIARRVKINLHTSIYPNLYYLMVAETSRYAKSTGMKAIFNLLVSSNLYHLLIPGQVTTEGIWEILSGRKPSNYDKLPQRDKVIIDSGIEYAAQRGIFQDEYSGILDMMKKDYMAGFVETLMDLYDSPAIKNAYTKSGGMSIMRRPYLSIFGATTPAALARALNAEQWENGAMARYMMMFRTKPLPYDDSYQMDHNPPSKIISDLMALHNNLPQPTLAPEGHYETDELTATISSEAHKAYKAYARAVRHDLMDYVPAELIGNYNRLHVQCLKIALCLATMDWSSSGKQGNITITIDHWAVAQNMTETSRDSLHRLMPVLNESSDARNQRAILDMLKLHSMTVRQIQRKVKSKSTDIKTALSMLIESGDIIEETVSTGYGSKQIYRLSE